MLGADRRRVFLRTGWAISRVGPGGRYLHVVLITPAVSGWPLFSVCCSKPLIITGVLCSWM